MDGRCRPVVGGPQRSPSRALMPSDVKARPSVHYARGGLPGTAFHSIALDRGLRQLRHPDPGDRCWPGPHAAGRRS